MTTKILNQAQHKHVAAVHLCSTGSMTKDGQPVGKVLKFTSNSKLMVGRLAKDFGQCHCTQKHAGLTNVDWAETAFYNEKSSCFDCSWCFGRIEKMMDSFVVAVVN